MSDRWVVRLPPDRAESAAALRLCPGLEVHEAPEGVWLRGAEGGDDLERALRMLPGAVRFSVLADGALVPRGRRVPCDRLPGGPWTPLRDWLKPELPPGAPPACVERSASPRLVRGGGETRANVLVLPFTAWAEWAEAAPAIRLGVLDFARCSDGRALVRGHPLPPLDGDRSTEDAGIALPCGLAWDPAVPSALLRVRLGLAAGDLALFRADGSWELVPAGAFVRARRSAVRASH